MNQHTLKIIWLIWLVLALLTTSTFTFISIALHNPELPLTLHEHQQQSWRVWRPFATSSSHFEMGYHRAADGDLRLAVLGDKTQNMIGESVLINLSVNGQTCTMQQDDVTAWNSWVFRPLYPLQTDCQLPERAGWNTWHAEIIQVSPKLLGESTRLGMLSPAKLPETSRYSMMEEIRFWGELLWLPFFLFMSIPLMIDGFNRVWAKFGEQIQWRWRKSLKQIKKTKR